MAQADIARDALALLDGHEWLVVGFGVLALIRGTASTARYAVEQYVAARRGLSRERRMR